jgi:2-oxo-4-hydroxy-4-carboxy-5-ureidoimidazoline decarboxylase
MSDSQHPAVTTPPGATPAPHTHLVLNAFDETTARGALARCCGARAWVEAVLAKRPYPTYASLDVAIDAAFDALTDDDWLEAFAAHPRIGETKARLRTFAHADDSAREQAGVDGAHLATLASLADGNRRYEACFGHVFLVCATGKSADEMLAILRSRLANRPEVERTVAATEQRKITRLRLAELR